MAKLQEVFRFEFNYQLRRGWPWLFLLVLITLAFLMARDGSLAGVLYEDFLINSPFAVAKTTVFGNLIWLMMAAMITGEAAARDVTTGMHPLVYTLPLKKATFLGGRFLAVLLLNALLLIGVQIGIALGVYLPGVQAEAIGPFQAATYVNAYSIIALPTVLAGTSIQFLFAAISRRPMSAYAGSFLLIFLAFFIASLLLFKTGAGVLVDPIGIRFIVEDLSHQWTTIEKNTRLINPEGMILTNRLLWMLLSLIALCITYRQFKFRHVNTGSLLQNIRRFASPQRQLKSPNAGKTSFPQVATPSVTNATAAPAGYVQRKWWLDQLPTFLRSNLLPRLLPANHLSRFLLKVLAISKTSFHALAFSWAGLALLIGIPLLSIPVILDQMESNGVPLVATTIQVLAELTAPISDELSRWIIIPLIIIYFAGELVWRERDAGMAEIYDTLPGSGWIPFLGKFLGLTFTITLFLISLMSAGIIAQTITGYHNYELWLYISILFGLQLPEYLLFAAATFAVHTVVNQKYAAHLVAVLLYGTIALASLFGLEHNLLIFGAGPGWSYTDMRGFGPTLWPWVSFKLYWVGWAILLAVAGVLIWPRGRETRLRVRLRVARSRITRVSVCAGSVALALIIGFGVYNFYNTNILNKYYTSRETLELRAEYERSYAKYRSIPQPSITGVSLKVDIYPNNRSARIQGVYHIANLTNRQVDSIHIAGIPGTKTANIKFDKPASLVLNDSRLGHQVYHLADPLAPGDSIKLKFDTSITAKGFRESGPDLSIVENGTFFTNSMLPHIGYQPDREIITAPERREFNLSARPVIASLYDTTARRNTGAGVKFEAIVSTNTDQLAIAPGALRREWRTGDRSYFHYVTDNAIGSEWSFYSAKYAVHEAVWRSDSFPLVRIRIYHHPGHRAHLAGMVESIRASLDYYTKQFGPYRFGHLTVIEHAGNGNGMHAESAILSHGEGFTTWNAKATPNGHDHPFSIVAHEMAHQWTIPYAAVEGAPVMSESLAWYYGLKAVEAAKGQAALQQLLHYMRQPYPYPPIRRGEPLLRGLDPYQSYRRGPFALYAISEYMGAAKMNMALRGLRDRHRQPGVALATTLDLYAALKSAAPDSLQYLLHDLFEVNTYWQLKTEHAYVVQTNANKWQLTLEIDAHKFVSDRAGVEGEVRMDDWIEVGVFAEDSVQHGFERPLYLRKHRIKSGKQTITILLSEKPGSAGIDPRNLLIDLQPNDNLRQVMVQ